MRHTRLAFALLLLLGLANAADAQETDVQKLLGNPDPIIQAQIQKIYDSQGRPDAGSNVDKELQQLKQLGDDTQVVKQLAIWVVNTKDAEEHDLVAGAVLFRLDVPPGVPIRVLAPCLDADDRQLSRFAQIWFNSYDKTIAARQRLLPSRPVNYDDYLGYLQWQLTHKEDVPASFVKFIVDRSPGQALLVFAYDDSQAKFKDRRDIELAEHIVSNAIWLQKNGFNDRFQAVLPEATDDLTKLAKHDQWWARLYVAEIMRQHRELRLPDVLQQLSTDSNELVSEAAKSAH